MHLSEKLRALASLWTVPHRVFDKILGVEVEVLGANILSWADELDRQAAEITTLTAECERLRENYEFALARVPTNRRQADGPDHRRPGPWTMVKRG